MSTLDLGPATRATADVVAGVRDDQLGHPTPCPAYTVGDLVEHVNGLSFAFTAAARKQRLEDGGDPSGHADRLPDDWRESVPAALAELAEAWRDPAAFEGLTQAGPVELPGDVAAMVALNEVVVHGWDLAVATGQPYDPDSASVTVCLGFAASFEAPDDDDGGPFGPPVAVASEAPDLDQLTGATGRRPDWTA